MGSSPLTRGKPTQEPWRLRRRRLIPAHAGKTKPPHFFLLTNKAHPRSRGENTVYSLLPVPYVGSSPLTRGKRISLYPWLCTAGLIPAHAGKTQCVKRIASLPWAHPRSRGENCNTSDPSKPARGSSPLTRGKQGVDGQLARPHRLIPAHAGKTPTGVLARGSCRAHPRSRGENPGKTWCCRHRRGSSPLTRGKPPQRPERALPGRLIPAHAGKTGPQPAQPYREPAHPRSRGENGWRQDEGGEQSGSSPLTRGKRAPGRQGRGAPGLIPAHAGKTGPPVQ